MGGSGKSHTAQRIRNDDRIKNNFDPNMWIHVTRDFDVVRLIGQILESAINNGHNQYTALDILQKNLIDALSYRKRFLLILDDVWCEDKMKWDLLLDPLNAAASNGSMIIITTRSEIIADTLNAKKFFLEELKTEDCWLVLKHYAFGNYDEIIKDQELINVGNQIIRKAKHSPLALRVVGSSLSNKSSLNEWKKILEQDTLKETMDLLLFTYQGLPSHLQRCFAYCSLFPKGYRFYNDVSGWKPDLISLWIAQGFIENSSELTPEEAGMMYIEELLSYSFFEKKEYCFVIHDLLHDLAEKISKKQCHRIEHHDSLHVPATCIHLSLCIPENLVRVALYTVLATSDIFKLRNLHSLIILRRRADSKNIFIGKKDIFQNLTKLHTLYVESYQQMEVLSDSRIGKLKHLRYLHLRHDSELPVSLNKLYQLRYFILITNQTDSNKYLLLTLSEGFSNLINLRTLQFYSIFYEELDYIYYNSGMINLEKLTSLQNLKKFYIDRFSRMVSLKNLPLGGSLSILNLENVKCKKEAEEATLNKKKNLNDLFFEWSDISRSIDTCEEVLEGLEPHRNLEKLGIRCYQGVKFPKWMLKENWLPHLQILSLESCKNLRIVSFLPPRLQELSIFECEELMQLPPLSDTLRTLCLGYCPKLTPPSAFLTNLEWLCLYGLFNLQALTIVSPSVTNLCIMDCPRLTCLGNLLCFTSLKRLDIHRCPMLRREEASLVEGVVEGDIDNRLPQLEHIMTDAASLVHELVQQQACSSIRFLALRDCAALPNLEKLSSLHGLIIKDCPDVESLPKLPVSLQSLDIDSCQKLKEKYEEGGTLCNTTSYIPRISIYGPFC